MHCSFSVVGGYCAPSVELCRFFARGAGHRPAEIDRLWVANELGLSWLLACAGTSGFPLVNPHGHSDPCFFVAPALLAISLVAQRGGLGMKVVEECSSGGEITIGCVVEVVGWVLTWEAQSF